MSPFKKDSKSQRNQKVVNQFQYPGTKEGSTITGNTRGKYNHFTKVCRAKVGKKVHTTIAAYSEDSPTDLENKFLENGLPD